MNPARVSWLAPLVFLINLLVLSLIVAYSSLNLLPELSTIRGFRPQTYFQLNVVLAVVLPAIAALLYLRPVLTELRRGSHSDPVPAHAAYPPTVVGRAANAPVALAVFALVGWLIATIVVVARTSTGELNVPASLMMHIASRPLFAGLIAALATFFSVEYVCRTQVWPVLLANTTIAGNRRIWKLRLEHRLLALWLAISAVPLIEVAAITFERLADQGDSTNPLLERLANVILLISVSGAVIGACLSVLVARSIVQPLKALEAATARVSDGRFDTRVQVNAIDEIGAVAEGFNSMVKGLRERELMREAFGRYVSPEVRDEILTHGVGQSGALREVTILFADLRNFTSWVEANPPAEIVADLNAYFSEMDAAIRSNRGLILQFIGDEIEAVFGAPIESARHADDALAAARQMSRRLDAWNKTRLRNGKPALRHGIGVHTGKVIAGNIGSSERQSYALVGDAVNVASRIQALNKRFKTEILVSDATRSQLSDKAGLELMPSVRVRGRSAEVSVFASRNSSVG